MKAIILAAGEGTRLRPYTQHLPKGLLPIGSTTLTHRNIRLLNEVGITDIFLVVGYLKEKFFEAFPSGVKFYVNEHYSQTDQAVSLFRAQDQIRDDLLILTADLYSPKKFLWDFLKDKRPICLAIEKKNGPFDNAIEKVLLKDGKIAQIGKNNVTNEVANGEFLGITKLKKEACQGFLQRLERLIGKKPKAALIDLFQQYINAGEEIGYIECRGSWCEVDDLASLEKAKTLLLREADGD